MKFKAEDEKAYLELIVKVAMHDIEAAVYMQTDMREIEDFEPDGNLWAVVYWGNTTQGHDYWENLAHKIGQ
jgi:hypothetical protein